MDLIEKLGLEKCKQIVDGAPENSQVVIPCSDGDIYFAQREDSKWFRYSDGYQKWLEYFGKCDPMDLAIKLADLRTEIDHHYYGQSEEKEFNSGDLVALNGELFPDFKLLYAVKQESKRFGFVAVYLSGEEIRNFHTRDVRRATEKELDLGYRVTQTPYSNTEYFNTRKIEADNCTDIKNHISPNTKVIEG